MLTVAVVIPAHNAEAYLADALRSVAEQTRPACEVFVVDDRSTDGTAAVARRWGATVLTTPVNSGPSAARNLGLRAATSDLIAFLDADDFWDVEHLATVAGLLDAHPTAVLANARCRFFGEYVGETRPQQADGIPVHVYVPMLAENPIAQTTAVARRAALLEAGAYDEGLRHSEDYGLWLRMARAHPFVFSHRVTGNYRCHDAQATRNGRALAVGIWTNRKREHAWLVAQPDAALQAEAEAVLRRALDADARLAWNAPDRAALEHVLALGAWVPGSAPIVRAWRRRLALWWPAWSALKRGRHALRRATPGPKVLK